MIIMISLAIKSSTFIDHWYIHKSQGSEFKNVIIPVLTQHFKMLYRNLIYTGLTRAKSLAVIVGTRKAFSMAIRQQDTSQRQTALETLIRKSGSVANSNSVTLIEGVAFLRDNYAASE